MVGLFALVVGLMAACDPVPAPTPTRALPTVAPGTPEATRAQAAPTLTRPSPTAEATRAQAASTPTRAAAAPEPTRAQPTSVSPALPQGGGEIVTATGRLVRIGTGMNARPMWSADGRMIVEPTTDGIYLLDGATLEPVRHLFSPVRDRMVATTPDGRLIVSASSGPSTRIEVWDAAAGTLAKTLGEGSIIDMQISPNGRFVAMVRANVIALWDLASGVKTRELRPKSPGGVYSVVISPDSRYVAAGSDQGFDLWEVTSSDPIATVLSGVGHRRPVFSPDSTRVLFTDQYKSIVVFDILGGKGIRSLVVSARDVAGATELAYSHDGSTIAAGVYDYDNATKASRYRILAWDANTFDVIAELPGHSAEIDRIAFTLDDRFLVSVSGAEHVARQWNVGQRRLERVVDADATWFDLSPNGRYILTSGPGSDRVWDTLTGEAVRTAPRLNGRITSPVFDRAGARIAFGLDNDVLVRDARSGAALFRLKGHTRPVDRVVFSPDGRMLASSGLDGIIRVWNAETGALVNALANPLPAPNPQQALLPERRVAPQIAFSPDGGLLASGSFQSEIRIWTMASPGVSRTLSADGEAVAGIAFSPDGASIAALSRVAGVGRVQMWAVASGRPSLFLGQGSKNSVGDLAFSPDGQLIAVASDHRTVNVWRASDGTLVSELAGHKDNVSSLAFNADGSRLASGAADKSAIVWDVARATAVFSDTSHTDAVDGIAFAPGGQTVATGSAGGGSIVLWALKP